jgi:hypothetical protein
VPGRLSTTTTHRIRSGQDKMGVADNLVPAESIGHHNGSTDRVRRIARERQRR